MRCVRVRTHGRTFWGVCLGDLWKHGREKVVYDSLIHPIDSVLVVRYWDCSVHVGLAGKPLKGLNHPAVVRSILDSTPKKLGGNMVGWVVDGVSIINEFECLPFKASGGGSQSSLRFPVILPICRPVIRSSFCIISSQHDNNYITARV